MGLYGGHVPASTVGAAGAARNYLAGQAGFYGYLDQVHLGHDFKALLDVTPAEYATSSVTRQRTLAPRSRQTGLAGQRSSRSAARRMRHSNTVSTAINAVRFWSLAADLWRHASVAKLLIFCF
jgi:hypothetical protein